MFQLLFLSHIDMYILGIEANFRYNISNFHSTACCDYPTFKDNKDVPADFCVGIITSPVEDEGSTGAIVEHYVKSGKRTRIKRIFLLSPISSHYIFFLLFYIMKLS